MLVDNLSIAWINDTSAYVGIKKDQNKKVPKQLMKANAVYKLQTYEEFRWFQRVKPMDEQSRPLNNGDALNRFKNGLTNSCSSGNGSDVSSGSTSTSSNLSEKKRTTQEDIGEIVSRPKKKTRVNKCNK